MSTPDLSAVIQSFESSFDRAASDTLWQEHSRRFRDFWNRRVLASGPEPISDDECDEIVRILDRNGRGNKKGAEAVAKAMIPQGAWRRMFNTFHSDRKLGTLVTRLMEEPDIAKKATLIDELYAVNKGQRNNLTGPSGNAVGALLAAYDPVNNLSIISLRDRRALIEFLELRVPFDWDSASIGTRIASTNTVLRDGLCSLGIKGSARTMTRFCYFRPMLARWKGDQKISTGQGC